MNQTTLLAIAIPLLLASALALWPAVTVPGSWADKERGRQQRTRQVLVAQALSHLRDVRARLEEVFRDADEGRDPYLLRADTRAVSEPVSEYVRLTNLQQGLKRHTDAARGLGRAGFWFLGGFVVTMLLTVAAGVLAAIIGLLWAYIGLATGTLVLLIGGGLFIAILMHVRAVDAVHRAADELRRETDDPSYDEILGTES